MQELSYRIESRREPAQRAPSSSPNTVHLARILTWARAKHLGVRVAAATAFHSCECRMNLGRKAVASATRTPRCFARAHVKMRARAFVI